MNVIPNAPAARPAALVYSTSTGCAPVSTVSEYVVSEYDVAVEVEAAWLMRQYGVHTRFTVTVEYSKHFDSEHEHMSARELASYLVDDGYYHNVGWTPEVDDLRVFFPPVLWAA